MTHKPITTLLRFAVVSVFVLLANLAAAQDRVAPVTENNVMTPDGKAPVVVSKSAATDESVATDPAQDGQTVRLTEEDVAALESKPALTEEEVLAPALDVEAMNTWVKNFEAWAAATPNHIQLLSQKEREYLASGDLYSAYKAMYNGMHRDAMRNKMNKSGN